MLQQALQKIQAELATDPKDEYLQVVGGFMIDYIRKNPQDAMLVMPEGKSIKSSLNVMKEAAQKKQKNGFGYISDSEGFKIVLKYFGVAIPEMNPAAVAGFHVSVDELLI